MTWQPSSSTVTEWGLYQITIGKYGGTPVDVTYFRGVPTKIDSYSFQEPYGEQAAQITFPQITEFDNLGSGDVSWLKVGSDVNINRITTGGTVQSLWCGFIMNIEVSFSETGGGVSIQCAGAFAGETALRMMRPEFFNSERDIGVHLTRIASNNAPVGTTPNPWTYRFKFNSATIGIMSRKGGSRNQTVLDYCDELLALAQDPADNIQWTIGRQWSGGVYLARQYQLRKKGTVSTNWTVQAGGRGVSLSLTNDLSDHVNAVYGEGVSDKGERWRNAKYPDVNLDVPVPDNLPLSIGMKNDDVYAWQMEMASEGYNVNRDGEYAWLEYQACLAFQQKNGLSVTGLVDLATWNKAFSQAAGTLALTSAYFAPLAVRKEVEPYVYTPKGSIVGQNSSFDRSIMRVERITSYGDGIYKSGAKESASREPIFRPSTYEDGWWHGEITLTMDPVQGSRLSIKEGDTITIKDGTTGSRQLHVVSIEVSPETDGLPVRLTVDAAQRDLMTVAAARTRNREARMDPARNFINSRRKSSMLGNVSGWDSESGAGNIGKRALVQGWNVFPVMLAQEGTVIFMDLETYDAHQEFVVALFGRSVATSGLNKYIGNPLSKNSDGKDPFRVNKVIDGVKVQDWLDERYFIEAWGTPDEPAGYWPNSKGDNGFLSGRLRDEVSWTFATYTPPWGYMAVYVKNACKFRGVPVSIGKVRAGVGMLVSINEAS